MAELLGLLSYGPEGWGDEIVAGLLITLALAAVTLPIGIALGFGLALAKNSGEPRLVRAATIFTTTFRALPELLTLLLIYYGGQIALQKLVRTLFDAYVEISSFAAGVVALSLVLSSFSSEVFLSAFRGIQRGQYEGAQALGLGRGTTMRLVVAAAAHPPRPARPLQSLAHPPQGHEPRLRHRAQRSPAQRQRRGRRHQGAVLLLQRRMSDLPGAGDDLLRRPWRHRALGTPRRGGAVSLADAPRSPLAPYVATRVAPAEPPPPSVFRPSLARRVGTALLGLWALIGAGLALYLWSAFDADIMVRYGPSILEGLVVTLELVGVSIVLGAALGLVVAAGRLSSNMAVQAVSFAYVYFFRGTPLLAQIFLVYYGAGAVPSGARGDRPLVVLPRRLLLRALHLHAQHRRLSGARSIAAPSRAVPRGQWEAALSLGLPGRITFFKIIAPQAMIIALRPLGNEIDPDDQGLGRRLDRHRARPDGRDPPRLLPHLRLLRSISGRRSSISSSSRPSAASGTSSRPDASAIAAGGASRLPGGIDSSPTEAACPVQPAAKSARSARPLRPEPIRLGGNDMAKVAFIGLGVMGYPMARHLAKKGGHDVTVYNRTAEKAEKWVGGAWRPRRRRRRAEAAEGADFVFTCVGNDDDLRAVDARRRRRASPAMQGARSIVDNTTASAASRASCPPRPKAEASASSTRPSPAARPAPRTARSPSWSAATRRPSRRPGR